jgi:hypothetical protein
MSRKTIAQGKPGSETDFSKYHKSQSAKISLIKKPAALFVAEVNPLPPNPANPKKQFPISKCRLLGMHQPAIIDI